MTSFFEKVYRYSAGHDSV